MYRPRWPLGRGVISSTGDQQGFTPLLHFVPAIPAPARAAQKVLLPALIPTVGDKTRCGHCLQKSRQLSPWSWNTPNRHLKAVMQYVMSNRAVHSPNVRRFEDSKYINTRTVRGLLCFPSKPPPQSIKRGSGPESSQSSTSLRSAAELQLAPARNSVDTQGSAKTLKKHSSHLLDGGRPQRGRQLESRRQQPPHSSRGQALLRWRRQRC